LESLHPKRRAEQSRHRQYFVIIHGQTPIGALQVHLELLFKLFQHVAGLDPIRELRGPVRHLHADEHAGHHDEKIDAYGEPVLVADVFHYAAQQHDPNHSGCR